MDVNPTDVQKALKDINHPEDREEPVETVQRNDASTEIVDGLRSLDGQSHDAPDEVEAAVAA